MLYNIHMKRVELSEQQNIYFARISRVFNGLSDYLRLLGLAEGSCFSRGQDYSVNGIIELNHHSTKQFPILNLVGYNPVLLFGAEIDQTKKEKVSAKLSIYNASDFRSVIESNGTINIEQCLLANNLGRIALFSGQAIVFSEQGNIGEQASAQIHEGLILVQAYYDQEHLE